MSKHKIPKAVGRPNYNAYFFGRSNKKVNEGTRQGRYLICWRETWRRWSCIQAKDGSIEAAPKDDRGVMPRRVRRSIARSLARQAMKKMRDLQIAQEVSKV